MTEVHWDELPVEVKAWYIDRQLKEEALEAAKPKAPDPRGQKIIRNPFAPEPLTRADGSVVYKDPQIPDWDQRYEAHCREQRINLTKVQR